MKGKNAGMTYMDSVAITMIPDIINIIPLSADMNLRAAFTAISTEVNYKKRGAAHLFFTDHI
jgi:hypothetical protein